MTSRTFVLDYPIDSFPRWGYERPPHPGLKAIIDRSLPTILQTLGNCHALRDHFATISAEAPEDPSSLAPWWKNPWFPPLDAIVLTEKLVNGRPRQLFEVGSGNSTRFARLAINAFGLPTRILSIDPQPRIDIDQLCDEVSRTALETVDPALFDRLEPGDVLFIDNSHQSFMNSDVTVFFTEILPRLRPGVIVQIHDICLPWDYPASFADRWYNEQYLLACWLLAAPERFDILASNAYVAFDGSLSDHIRPLWTLPGLSQTAISAGSFWFRLRH